MQVQFSSTDMFRGQPGLPARESPAKLSYMGGTFEILEHTADIGLRARGATPSEACESAALGLMSLLVAPESVRARQEETVAAEGVDAADLLVRWLHEVLFLIDAHRRVFATVRVTDFEEWRLKAVLSGEPFDPRRHKLREEIKAVTYHGARFEPAPDGWIAEVLFDV